MIKIEADTLEEAYKKASDELNCSFTELNYEIVQHPKNGFLGFGKKNAIIIATVNLENSVKADPILPLKFDINISKRAVRYFMQVVDYNLEKMPDSTRLYFLKVEEILSSEMDKTLV